MARKYKPAAITLDVLMPRMDGFKVLTALKSDPDPDVASIPVVMLTIQADKSVAFALGASDYLSKPVKKESLVEILQKYRCLDGEAVMVVEDSDDNRELLTRLLKDEGIDVIEAGNGKLGLAALEMEERLPSLIILDLMMPEMDGFEFADQVQQHEVWRTIPICVVTAKDLTSEEYNRLGGQVDKILAKGAFDPEEMSREIKQLLKRFMARKVGI
jgi:CheY-like chemotaxis protein